MKCAVSYVLALSLILGVPSHAVDENELKEQQVSAVALEDDEEADNNDAHLEHYLVAIGVLVLFTMQGFSQYSSFVKYTSR